MKAKPESSQASLALAGIGTADNAAVHERVLEGLPYAPVRKLQKLLELSISQIAELLQIPSRTLARRKAEGKLLPVESDRLVRSLRLFEETVSLFEGDEQAAREWFKSAQPALGGKSPFEFARTDAGAREVERAIGRLEHGVTL
jgi:putative toxin-antitoxin system antitoxin component (TIGR02293 family)